MWGYIGLAVVVVLIVKLLATILVATERAALNRANAHENHALRARVDRYTAR